MIQQITQSQQQQKSISSEINTSQQNNILQQSQHLSNIPETLYNVCEAELNHVQQVDNRFEEYIQILKQYGANVSVKLQCGFFHLKNGLKYPGMYAKEEINPDAKGNLGQKLTEGQKGKEEFLLTIPIQMLLTSYKAQNEADQQLKAIYKNEQFYHEGPIWQDRILVTYLLYSLAYNKDTLWAKMASYFSKDVDIISFWPQKDLNCFLDKSVIKAAQLQRQNFEKQWQKFQQIQQKYPVLQPQLFTHENYKWIYTHAISRCFGSYMNSTYFVPYCQFLNHNCVDVSYCCLEKEEYEKRVNEKEGNSQENINNEVLQQQSISSISQCSGDSQNYIQQGDFSYYEVPTYTIKWCSKVSYKLKPKQTQHIQQLQQKVINYLEIQLKWKGISLMYIGEILEKVNLIGNQYMAERKKYGQAKEELELLLYHVGQFKRHVKKYYKGLGSVYMKDTKEKFAVSQALKRQKEQNQVKTNKKQEQTSQIQINNYIKTNRPPQKPYKYFAMICHPSQYFPKNSQVYFQYGRLSNRTLLLRYGFCLENNRYQHVWIRQDLKKQIGQYPDLFNKIQQKGLPVTMNIKLKPYVLNTELIMLEKIEKWKMYGNVEQNGKDFCKMFGIWNIQYEIEIIEKIRQIYRKELSKYQYKAQSDNLKLNQYGLIDLTDKNLGYHDYFRAVYHNEKIKILLLQIELLEKSKNIFKKILNQKIPIIGNLNLLKILKRIVIQEMGSRKKAKFIWGYTKTLEMSIIK